MDLIDRQDAQMAVQDHYNKDHGFRSYEDGQRMLNRINALPSAQKTGKWIPVDSFSAYGGDQIMWEIRGNPVAFHYCSACREDAYTNEDGDEILSEFCPFCGARMVSEEEKDYERAIEDVQYNALYEPTYNQEDGSL